MAEVHFQINGLDRVGVRLAQLGPLFVQQAHALVAETVLYAETAIADKIDEYEAVDTGRLKGSISAKTEFQAGDSAHEMTARNVGGIAKIEAVVGTNVGYAIPVHEGWETSTGKQIEGRPFMEDTIPDVEDLFNRRATERFGSLL